MFGHGVPFNFNQKGSHHQTFAGGFCSVLISGFMCVYVLLNVLKMLTYQGDTQDSTIRATDYVAFPNAKEYDAKGNFIFWVLKDTSNGNKPLFLDDPRLKEDKDANTKAFAEISFY